MPGAIASDYFDEPKRSQEQAQDEEQPGIIAAMGLNAFEVGSPQDLFTDMYREAEERGIYRTAHGGEGASKTYIGGALDSLYAQGIYNGVHIMEDLGRSQSSRECWVTTCSDLRSCKNSDNLRTSYLAETNIPT
ncbi:hypothetical protein FOYG_03939 [Fusarium oxysporum NRRL 32931]|uniref:Adenosine deaminase domain-containing protein n=1 Tax=Fusarium oxysporum NRRL 32931 TaxID=660029 RepID=W9J5F3_FUSOX|nr:hypothetical protein FOYG_03939 [Fusarium oxysporum NRRL 32931]